MKSGFSYVRDVYESGTEPGPEYYICHPNAVTATHVWRRILCNSTHTSAAPSLQDSVCVCVCMNMFYHASVLSYVHSYVCTMYVCDIWTCAYVHACRCVCRCVRARQGRLMLSLTVLLCLLCLCDRLTCAQMVDDEHMNFTSHFTCWHDNSVKAYMMKM